MDGVAKQQKMLKEAHPMAPPKQQSKPVPIKPEDEKDEENEGASQVPSVHSPNSQEEALEPLSTFNALGPTTGSESLTGDTAT
ncbi:uncharacterized protein PG998_009958 [Apiospora kogelbergensis]|uniref:uncharacterized protein n=1 Tax=Apiospora kogelbergensis TaxID=1337665 RepID=UPI0031308F3B